MKDRSPALPEKLVLNAQLALSEIALPLNGLRIALVSTLDGFEVASVGRSSLSVVKLAALTSSLMAMATAAGTELKHSNCRRLIFDSDQGTFAVMPVESEPPSLLCCVVDSSAVLGQVLWTMGEVVSAIRSAR